MARPIVWSDPAVDDLEAAVTFIAKDSDAYARSLAQLAVDVTTKARVQAFLASGGQNPAPLDSLLPTLISEVSARFERFCGSKFKAESTTEVFDVDETTESVLLEAYPVSTIATVKYDPAGAFGADTTLAATNYVLEARLGLLKFKGYRFSRDPQSLQVVYTGGLGADAAAIVAAYPDLAHAAELQIASLAKQRFSLGASAFATGGGGSTSFVGAYALLPEVLETLKSFRRYG